MLSAIDSILALLNFINFKFSRYGYLDKEETKSPLASKLVSSEKYLEYLEIIRKISSGMFFNSNCATNFIRCFYTFIS